MKPSASTLKSHVEGIPALMVLNPVSSFVGVYYRGFKIFGVSGYRKWRPRFNGGGGGSV